MLPAAHRLTGSATFRTVVRSGDRAGSRTLVVHLVTEHGSDGPRVGLVVSRAVGRAVTRNRVQRRLRHLVREHLDRLPPTSALVIRALPAAASADGAELRADLARCLDRVVSHRRQGVSA